MELNKEQLDLLSAIGKDDYECELHYCKIQDLDFLIKNGLSNNVGVGKHEITDKGIARLKEEEAKPTLDIPESLEDYFDWYDVLLMGEPDYKEDGVAVASEDYYYYFLRDPGDISVGIDSYDYSPSFKSLEELSKWLYDNEEKYLRYFTLADDNECSEEMRELGNELRRKENEDI